MANGSVSGVFVILRGIGSSYVMVSAEKCVMTCVSRNGPLYGVGIWYQLLSGIISKVIV